MSEFNEFEPRLKSAENQFRLSAGLNLEKLNNILKWNQPYLSLGSNSLNSASEGTSLIKTACLLGLTMLQQEENTWRMLDGKLVSELLIVKL